MVSNTLLSQNSRTNGVVIWKITKNNFWWKITTCFWHIIQRELKELIDVTVQGSFHSHLLNYEQDFSKIYIYKYNNGNRNNGELCLILSISNIHWQIHEWIGGKKPIFSIKGAFPIQFPFLFYNCPSKFIIYVCCFSQMINYSNCNKYRRLFYLEPYGHRKLKNVNW